MVINSVDQFSYEDVHIKMGMSQTWTGMLAAKCHILQNKEQTILLEIYKDF